MTGYQLLNRLERAEINPAYAGDTRRMMRGERYALRTAIGSRDGTQIQAAITEALRVARMWGVNL